VRRRVDEIAAGGIRYVRKPASDAPGWTARPLRTEEESVAVSPESIQPTEPTTPARDASDASDAAPISAPGDDAPADASMPSAHGDVAADQPAHTAPGVTTVAVAPPQPSSATSSSATAKPRARGAWATSVVITLVLITTVVTFGYSGLCAYVATRLVYIPQTPVTQTPTAYGLAYRDVTFPSRIDHVMLKGWFIPGVLPHGRLTAQRTLILLHGTRTNRIDVGVGLLALSAAFARRGFAVLAFDMRGMGESPPAPFSLGYFEQRDALGAVDFLRSGPLPFPALGRPHAIGGWGVSLGAATLLLAAAQEPAIRAVVSDSAYADIIPILERVIPQMTGLPSAFTPGVLTAARVMYGVNYYAVRPVDVVARLAPRPVLFIHGAADTYIPPSNMTTLADAARQGREARVQTWLVPGAQHAKAYKVAGQAYVDRVVAFFDTALGPDTSGGVA